MLRNQYLKNNASLDLYEGYIDIQKKYKKLNKIRLRQIDNNLFMSLYKPNEPEYKEFLT